MTRAMRFGLGLMLAFGMTVPTGRAAEFGDPVRDALAPMPPVPDGLADVPLVTRPSESRPTTPQGLPADGVLRAQTAGGARRGPVVPPVEFEENGRVVLLGELFSEDVPFGYLETRLTSQWPERDVRFRNLGWPSAGLAALEQQGRPTPELERLLQGASSFRPTTVCLSLGRQDAATESVQPADFRAAYERLLDRLTALVPETPPKLVVFSPASHEAVPSVTRDTQAANQRLSEFIVQTLQAATNRHLPFLNLFGYSMYDSEAGRRRATNLQTTLRYHTDDGCRLNAFGLWRLTYGMERALRWPANSWRFGYMADGGFRDGGFGIDLIAPGRSSRSVTMRARLSRLPTPNPVGVVDRWEDSKPQCYVQITGFEPGLYELRVDDVPVVTATHEGWGLYQVIAEGPDWTQADELRRAIVAKNRIVSRWLEALDSEDQRAVLEAEIAAVEERIVELRKPVTRNWSVQRIGAAPATPVR